MNKPISTIAFVILTIIFFIVLSLLPIYPLLVEGREISSAGESLYQEWRLVSLNEYFEYSRFARAAWLESTSLVYYALLIGYVVALSICSILSAKRIVRFWKVR